jgi:hypothetical protein
VRTHVRPFFALFTIRKGHAFRQDGRYFVLAERHKSKDTIGVYDTTNSFSLARVSLLRSSLPLLNDHNNKNKAFPLANVFYELLGFVSKRKSYRSLGRSPGGLSRQQGERVLSLKLS